MSVADIVPRTGRRARASWTRIGMCLLAILSLAPSPSTAQTPAEADAARRDLSTMSLEELTQIDVTLFRNKVQKLSSVAGAVYVISHDQIERSGLNSVPELLRMVPGLHVAQVNGGQWSISSRGTGGVMQPRLLVLIDGRSIYSPVFSGVYWDMGMPLLEDIDRIEVIRGPGATIWGANAVLGVINIVTRDSRHTQGTLVSTGAGSQERAFGRLRFGGSTKKVAWRAYALAEDHAPFDLGHGSSARDGWSTEQIGFRVDGEQEHGSWMLEGSAAANSGRLTNEVASLATLGFQPVPMEMLNAADNVTGEIRRAVGDDAELRVNFYFDQVRRQNTIDRIAHTSTWNGDIRYDFIVARRHSLSVGGGVRALQVSIPGTGGTAYFTPESRDYATYNTFAQDEISLWRDRLYLTLGAKLEHNPFTDWGLEPSASLLWQMNGHHSVWTSAARALRTPSYVEWALNSPLRIMAPSPQTGGLPLEVDKQGNPLFGNEIVTDYQVGYRGDLTRSWSVSVALYRDRYQHFRSVTSGAPAFQRAPVPSLVAAAQFTNFTDGNGRGAETTLAWQRFHHWKLEGSHTYAASRTWPMAGASGNTMVIDVFTPPRNQWVLRSSWNPRRSLEFDIANYWTGHTLSRSFLGDVDSPAYSRLDARIGYRVGEHWTMSLVAQNLPTPRHAEGIPETLTSNSYVVRGAYLKSLWSF